MSARAFTPEQAAAIADRAGSALLAANAGSGKTAVMVERFAEAVRVDGVPVSAVLALTFTDKAAGELRERLRRRLAELGEAEHARAVDGAWIGTIHGFCARVLRSQPLPAGLDPRFEVLDEGAAGRLAGTAYDRALDAWVAAEGAPALDLAAAYGPGLRDMILGASAALRSRGMEHPRLRIPPPAPAPDAGPLARARAAAAAELAGAGDGQRVAAARDALAACDALLARGGIPWPGDLAAAELKTGAKVLQGDVCEAYRTAFAAYRAALAAHHERAALAHLDGLLRRFGAAYAEAKAARAGVDFDDLELRVRALLADPLTRRRWAERFALIMVDEFQDTNRLQLDLLEALERDNLFAVGDEFQSIYRFRHADVGIFRARRRRLGDARVRGLAVNFRSREELLDALNAGFAAELGDRFAPLRAGRREAPAPAADGPLRLFDPDTGAADAAPVPVELLVTAKDGWDAHEAELGLGAAGDAPWRRAEARLVAQRLRDEVDAGRRPGDVVVLVRATASLRLLEEALEEQGLPTYVVGGRGYWSSEQVRDGLAWLAVLANPRDEAALHTVLASPFCGVGTDALVALAQAAREGGAGAWAALRAPGGLAGVPRAQAERLARVAALLERERAEAERRPVEVLLERALRATGYDLAVLARQGGERRLANLRKLMRLARDYERAEGRDLRGFLSYAAAQDLGEAREGEAALESEGLDAVRLMTIHRAKGLEFPVVCVADLGRAANTTRPRLLVGEGGAAGLRLAPVGGGETVTTPAWERLAEAEAEADAEEERRLFYVAMTRAQELLVLAGGTSTEDWPAPRTGGPPVDWIARALAGDPVAAFARPRTVVQRAWSGRTARVACALNAPATLGDVLRAAAPRPRAGARPAAPGTALPAPAAPRGPEPPRARPAPERLSYTSLADYAECPYRYYLRRVLRLPAERAPAESDGAVQPPEGPAEAARTLVQPALDPRVRGTLVHRALEALDFARPAPPTAADVLALAEEEHAAPRPEEVEDVRALVAAFGASPLCARLAAARRPRREAPFAFALEEDGSGPLLTGFVDVLAEEADGTVLVVDYKTDRLDGTEPPELVERAYTTQRTVYALAALRGGAPRVEVAYCLLERPGTPVARTFTQADVPELAATLSGLAAGLRAHEHPVAPVPHRDLCGECPGRRALCSWPEAMTLRPAPAQASAGSLAGSDGPS